MIEMLLTNTSRLGDGDQPDFPQKRREKVFFIAVTKCYNSLKVADLRGPRQQEGQRCLW